MEGRISSVQSMGAVDGPGLRYVVFMQGCPLRCKYCHNPETWSTEGGTTQTADELCRTVARYKPYFVESGGITVSGGEPLMQADFVAELFEKLHREHIHTALDTSGAGSLKDAEKVLRHTDLVLCDLKFTTEEAYRENCGGSLRHTLEFLKLTEKMGIPVWIRHVVAPGLTDTTEGLLAVKTLCKAFPNIEKIEWLPFKNLCVPKYESLGLKFQMGDAPALSAARLEALLSETE